MSERRSGLWDAVDGIVGSIDVPTIFAHQLAPLAAVRWRELGRQVPSALLQQERAAQLAALMAIPALARAREAYSGRMMILKGPEIELLYPRGGRLFGDLDLLVDDAPAAFDALVAAGFAQVPRAADRLPVHLTPLRWPGNPLPIELHLRPNWPRYLTPPSNAQLFEAAMPARTPVQGLEAPAPAHHALIVAAHAWKHMPLSTVRDLIDVSVLAHESESAEIERIAQSWGMTGIWRTTTAAATWVLEHGGRPVSTRVWARHLQPAREATILERHVRRWVTPFWMLPPGQAVTAAVRNIATDARPLDGEGWGAKLRRVVRVATHPGRTRSQAAALREHDGDF